MSASKPEMPKWTSPSEVHPGQRVLFHWHVERLGGSNGDGETIQEIADETTALNGLAKVVTAQSSETSVE